MSPASSSFAAYFKQQSQLDMPDYFFSEDFDIKSFFEEPAGIKKQNRPSVRQVATPLRATVSPVKSRGLPLRADQLIKANTAVDAVLPEGKRSRLARLFRETKTCRLCGLCESRVNVVFGSGNAEAVFLVIGKVPQEEDDSQGLPFCGKTGEVLNGMLASINIDRKKQTFVTDIVKCRTPSDRLPEESEISGCMEILAGQIKILEPKVILLLGKTVAQVLLDTNSCMDTLRAETHSYKGIPAMVTYNPSDILLDNSLRVSAREDMVRLKKILEEAGVYGITSK